MDATRGLAGYDGDRPVHELAARRARPRVRRLRRAVALVGRRPGGLLGRAVGLLRHPLDAATSACWATGRCPGPSGSPGARLNYAEHLVGLEEDRDRVAVVARSQTRGPRELTFGELIEQAGRVRAGLQRLGVQRGDRVVAYMPNIPETLIGFIATASLGAIWATCAPEFGARSVVDRFAQIEPRVLMAVGGYGFRDRYVDRRAEVETIRGRIPSIEHVVWVPFGEARDPGRGRRGSELTAETRAARVRAGPVRPPDVRAVLLGHDRAAEADRARPRRPADRAPQEPRVSAGTSSPAAGCCGSRQPRG